MNKLEKQLELRDNNNRNLIIIPGSCSSDTNWFDQIEYFTNHGFDVHLVNLPDISPSIEEASKKLFTKIWQARTELEKNYTISNKENQPIIGKLNYSKSVLAGDREREEVFEPKEDKPQMTNTIICHSMGGMQLLNIISHKNIFDAMDHKTFDFITSSNIFFIQVPLHDKKITIFLCKMISILCYPIMYLWSKFLFKAVDQALLKLKQSRNTNLLVKLFDSIGLINHLSIANSFLGTSPKQFRNLINYYIDWNLSDLEDKEPEIKTEEKYIMKALPGDDNYLPIKDNISKLSRKHFFFSTGGPDMFCSSSRTRELVKKIEANRKDFPLSFHLPMHFPWCQDQVHKWVIESIARD